MAAAVRRDAADRASGKLMTISLWDSRHDLDTVEARAAQLREEAAEPAGTAVPPVEIYQVEIAGQA